MSTLRLKFKWTSNSNWQITFVVDSLVFDDERLVNSILLFTDDQCVREIEFGDFGGVVWKMVGVADNQLKKRNIF